MKLQSPSDILKAVRILREAAFFVGLSRDFNGLRLAILLDGALTMVMGLRAALACAVIFLVVVGQVAVERSTGQEKSPAEKGAPEEVDESFKVLKPYCRFKAKEYEFTLDTEGKQKLVLQPVAMTYTGLDYQSVSGTTSANFGELYIWTYQGRVIVAGGIGSFPRADRWNFFHEFHVLTERAPQPTNVNSLPGLMWRPKGEAPKPIPGAPDPFDRTPPTTARSRRLTQMRELAKEFSGTTMKPDDSGDRPLQLLPTPAYRLDPAELAKGDHKIVDGAVFVFMGPDGTDAEMLLYIECRKTDKGLQWTYVPAAMTYLEMWMAHKGEEVWHIPNYRNDQRQHNYFTAIVESITSLDEMQKRVDAAEAAKREPKE